MTMNLQIIKRCKLILVWNMEVNYALKNRCDYISVFACCAGCNLLCLSVRNVPLVAHLELATCLLCRRVESQVFKGVAKPVVVCLCLCCIHINSILSSSPWMHRHHHPLCWKSSNWEKHKILHNTNFHRLSIDFKWTLFDLECSWEGGSTGTPGTEWAHLRKRQSATKSSRCQFKLDFCCGNSATSSDQGGWFWSSFVYSEGITSVSHGAHPCHSSIS